MDGGNSQRRSLMRGRWNALSSLSGPRKHEILGFPVYIEAFLLPWCFCFLIRERPELRERRVDLATRARRYVTRNMHVGSNLVRRVSPVQRTLSVSPRLGRVDRYFLWTSVRVGVRVRVMFYPPPPCSDRRQRNRTGIG